MTATVVRIDGAKFYAEGSDSTDDNLTVVANMAGGLRFVIEEPWAGDSETGFGKECEFCIDINAAEKLLEFLGQWLGSNGS